MILIPRDIGGTVECYAPDRPDAGPTVEVLNRDGGTVVAAGTATTLDSVNTTISEAVPAGSKTVNVTSATGIVTNRRYLLSDGTDGQKEFVEVRDYTGTVMTLKSPLVYNHASAATFQGTRISYAIAAAVADVEEDHWRAEFTWLLATVAQPTIVVEFTVTRHPVLNPASMPDLFAVEPLLRRKLATDTDLNDALARAWDEVLDFLWARGVRPGTIVGSNKLRWAVVYHCLMLCSEQYGREYREEHDFWEKQALQRLDAFKITGAIDVDEDAALEDTERGGKGGMLYRAS